MIEIEHEDEDGGRWLNVVCSDCGEQIDADSDYYVSKTDNVFCKDCKKYNGD